MPMHCSANVGDRNDVAMFFGLSGTGKTTLVGRSRTAPCSATTSTAGGRDGVFNFEGGCYAKTIRLSREAEPEIFATTERFGTVLENVIVDPITRVPDFDDALARPRTRAAPIRSTSSRTPARRAAAGIPKNIVMLTCDAFGVLPPIAKLTPAEAMYHFLSGYTAKVAGTEKGVKDPEATFSTCFGAPFMPRHPVGLRQSAARPHRQALGGLLARQHRLDRRQVRHRPPHADPRHAPPAHRRARRLAQPGAISGAIPYFGFAVPTSVPGVEPHILYPVKTWQDKAAFAQTAKRLVDMFNENFKRFENHVDADVRAAAPQMSIAA